MTPNGPFPELLPDPTSDPDAIARNDWDAFRAIDTLRSHWAVKRWPPGRTGYYWYLTFDDPDLVALADQCQQALTIDGVDPVPLDGLHITLSGIGTTTAVTAEQIDDLISLAREKLSATEPFDLAVGPLTGSRSAIRFSVSPWDPLLALHHELSMCTANSLPRPSASATPPTSRFRPHMGVAYNNTDRAAAEVIAAVAALRGLGRATVRVKQVELVVVRREGRCYRWDVRAEIPLGSRNSFSSELVAAP